MRDLELRFRPRGGREPGRLWVAGLGTQTFGLAAASVAALTGRLGGAIIAHVTFNALVVVPALF
jgi:uncharacterized protein